ncbi:hypothetical protein [Kutzneria kofuensis]|uniref:hypothetical protein n=1 Tax=Kutzneria kofuensis TaxID=103725 RepID=UPI0031EB4F87
MLSADQRAEAADRLRDAERDRVPIPPLTSTWPDIDVVDAYEIQLLNIRRRGGRCWGTRWGCRRWSCSR